MAVNSLKKKLFPADLGWNILNNLDKFNDKSNLIALLSHKFDQLVDHTIFGKFTDLFAEAVKFYEKHNSFPDVAYLNKRFPEGKLIKVLKNEEFSMTFYEDLVKNLDYEILIKKFNDILGRSTEVDIQGCLELSKDLARFATTNETLPESTKEGLLNSYEDYVKDYRGIKTGMTALDNVIGVLGFRSLSVYAAPSGHGKSTFAITQAYNSAVNMGMHVCYVSFEVPARHIWFNLASIESSYSKDSNKKIPSSKMKEALLTQEEREYYKEHVENMMAKIKACGGYIDVVDQTEMPCDTFEQFCAKLEERAEKVGRPADLIIVDNVDNLQVLKSSEKDETTKVNQYIIALDKFTKTYKDGVGTAMLLLSQVNRTGLKKMMSMESTGDQEVNIDVTCIQKFNALYEKATTVLVGFSSPKMRVNNEVRVMPVKLRNRALPTRPVSLGVAFEYSKLGGDYKENVNSMEDLENSFETATATEGEWDVNEMEFGAIDE